MCVHLSKTTNNKEGYYCTSAKMCENLGKVYNCPIIEYAREYEAFMSGKIQEGKYYEFVVTGHNNETNMDTYSLLLKRDKPVEKEVVKVVLSKDKLDEVARLLDGK